jgi:hypothetical protein
MTAVATPPRSSTLGRVDELLGRPVSMRAMALLRILVAPIVLLHLRPLLEDAWRGDTYRDHFHEAYASWYPQLPRTVYIGLLWMAAFAAVAMVVGFRARAATITVWAVVTYDLFLSTTNFHNNRAYLVLVLAALDWLARFRIEPAPGRPFTLVDRDGRTSTGWRAVAMTSSRLPVVASFALPVVALGRLTRRRSPSP